MKIVYRSKIGWIFGLYVLLLLTMTVNTVFMKTTELVIIFSTLILIFVLYFALLLIRTKYIFEDDKLVIRGIVSRREIPYDTVKRIVEDSKDPINYRIVMLSMDRIGIYHGENGYTLISPKNKKEATRILKSRCSNFILN